MKKSGMDVLAGVAVVSVLMGICIMNVGVNAGSALEENKEDGAITVQNCEEKIQELRELDVNALDYNTGISEVEKCDTYCDESGNIYGYDDNGEMISFLSADMSQDVEKEVNKKQVMSSANEFLKAIVGEEDKYSFRELNYDEYTEVYNVIFERKDEDVKTTDVVYLTINKELELTGFSKPHEGAFDNVILLEKDEKKIKSKAIMKFAEEHSLANYSNLVVGDYVLDEEEGVIWVHVHVKYNEGKTGEGILVNDIVSIPVEDLVQNEE